MDQTWRCMYTWAGTEGGPHTMRRVWWSLKCNNTLRNSRKGMREFFVHSCNFSGNLKLFQNKKVLKNPVKCIVCRTSAPLDSDRRDAWWDLEVNKRLSRRVAKKADRVRDKRARLGPDLVTYQLSDLEEATLPLWASNDSMHLLRVPCDFNKVCDSSL